MRDLRHFLRSSEFSGLRIFNGRSLQKDDFFLYFAFYTNFHQIPMTRARVFGRLDGDNSTYSRRLRVRNAGDSLDWMKITCVLPSRQGLAAVTDIFNDFFPNGTMVDDPQAILSHVESDDWDAHEFSSEILAQENLAVSDYLEMESGWQAQAEALQERVDAALAALNEKAVWQLTRIPDEDWAESWKEHYDVHHYGTRIQLVPEWLEPDVPEDIVIRIDPGMAFGTGEHETTSLCMNWLEELIQPEMTVFDVGTGSGILAIAARALGAGRVDAMDNDPVAVWAAVQNAARNNAQLMIYKSDLLRDCVGQADLIIANIVADVILTLVPQLESHLTANGRFLCSGVLVTRANDVQEALVQAGFDVLEKREDGEWCAILAERKEGGA